jgi:phosphate transport system substrate-binding protein
MKFFSKLIAAIFLFLFFISCNKSNKSNQETILTGKTSLLVDETFRPIIEDQIEVFESRYDAKIILDAKSENEIIQALINGTHNIAVLSRKLSSDEMKIFQNKKVIPRTTAIATDAIAFIASKNTKDTLVNLIDVIDFMNGKPKENIKGLVFDDPNSSTVRYMNNLAGITVTPQKDVFSFGTSNEVIKFVADNEGMIGIVGLNWLSQPHPDMQKYVDNVSILSIKGLQGSSYYAPDQNNIAEGTYPLARELFIINCQGSSGLGMGFASFVAGDIGQRIILKSGLLPIRIPPRKLSIRKEITNEKQ